MDQASVPPKIILDRVRNDRQALRPCATGPCRPSRVVAAAILGLVVAPHAWAEDQGERAPADQPSVRSSFATGGPFDLDAVPGGLDASGLRGTTHPATRG